MRKITLIFLILCNIVTYGQNKETKKILEEGKLLYRLEKGSWYGTDHLLERFQTKRDSIGGYISYEGSSGEIYTVFFSRFNIDEILVRYQFDSVPQPNPTKVDVLNRASTQLEKDLITMYLDARERVFDNNDSFFTFYENTSLNFIPLIINNEKRVFILTAPQVTGIVIIGNDYILNYDKRNNFKTKSKIHNSILQFPYQSDDKENPIETTMHSHVIDSYISSTDICTFLLYKDFVEWKQHLVISDKEVSIFNLENESLLIMKRKDWEEIINR